MAPYLIEQTDGQVHVKVLAYNPSTQNNWQYLYITEQGSPLPDKNTARDFSSKEAAETFIKEMSLC